MITTRYKAKQIYLIFFIGMILSACRGNKKVDVSNIDLEVKIERFDQDFDAMRTHPMAQQAIHLHNKYKVFYQDFIERILPVGSIRDTAYFKTLRNVFANKAYNDLRHDVEATYPKLDKQEAELTDAFKHIKYYYPQKRIPKVYSYFSGFQAQTSIGDGYFAIGLDLFLGANSRFYPSITSAFPHYLSRHFTPENITPRVVEGIAREDMFPESDDDKSLLTKMIYNGKIMYFMDKILPDAGDTLKISYTRDQLKWCTDFEPKIWAYFLEENLLYETDYPKIQKYLTEAPFTPGLGERNESAPKLAVWTGWQIVRAYMDKHPEVTLQQLMANKDAQKILNESKYRPK
ncbi:gliding motility lipoprotein GldB [Mucilaginibacter sp. KACC 22773]|uniref:gliding motility lipoprotein GldB n=1 Tax=Mucilaginibacter sp. KACC 22773 TaxID=3025671 RepID=UPI002366DBE2|nr:gliding motility lipoprotein GldB [Mucilaginibacter sp. KACC 22773]WDF76921.1 gliding motility lipoprotein GldB [Mucilaginibacter sp. KACC 22773]